MDVSIGLKFKNNSDEYIRYEVESVSTVIEGKYSLTKLDFVTKALVAPDSTNGFLPPSVIDAPLRWRRGSMSLSVLYGDAAGPMRYRAQWEYAVDGQPNPQLPLGPTNVVQMVASHSQEIEEIQ